MSRELEKAKEAEIIRIKADLIIQHQHQITKGMNVFTVHSYETDKEEVIQLDRLLSPLDNAKQFYKKYKKTKTSINHLSEQIKNTLSEIQYFELLMVQIETASGFGLLSSRSRNPARRWTSRASFARARVAVSASKAVGWRPWVAG